MTDHRTIHQPVLRDEVLDILAPRQGESYLDLTAGYGGHAQAILSHTHGPATLVDRDEQAVEYLKEHIQNSHVEILWQDFLSASQKLADENRSFDLILADLGVSSPHLDNASRGFSIQQNGPLDMRMDKRQTLTADYIVNTADEVALRNLISQYGEERQARRIAQRIVERRPIKTTSELAAIVAAANRVNRSKVHPATRTFQALRIAVNDELTQLKLALPFLVRLLAPGGRVAIISFHSLEDRIVKQFFAEHAGNRYDAQLRLLTKRPITARHSEIVSNPRARSAKLRAVAKINIKTANVFHETGGKKKG